MTQELFLWFLAGTFQIRTTFRNNSAGRQTKITNARGYATTTVYDDANRMVANLDPLGYRTSTTYDANSRRIASVDQLGKRTTFVYDNADRLIANVDALAQRTTFGYDVLNRQTMIQNPLGHRATSVYNIASQLIAQVDPLNNRTSFVYDQASRQIAVQDANNKRSTTVFDVAGKPVATQNALGYRTTSIYDAAGQRSAILDARNNRTSFAYDPVGNRTLIEDPIGNRTTFGYDLAGQRTLRQDGRGNVTTYAFDNAGQLAGWLYPDATRVTFAYDQIGNRTLAHDYIGRYTTTYDELDRKSTYVTPINKLITYAYDPRSSRTLLVEPEGGRFTIAYDDLARTSMVVNPQSDRTTYSYDVNSRRTGTVLGNQTRCSWTYDNADRPTRVLNLKSDGTTISMFDYALDNVGNRTEILYADGKRATYTYDDIYQLKREQNGPIDYDATFTYDPVGNRTVVDDGLLTTSTYDDANQLVAQFDVKTNTTFTFDRNGNQIAAYDSGTQIVTQVWDYEDRMTAAAVAPLDLTFIASYDPDHRRVSGSQTVGKDTSAANFLWDDENVLKKYLLNGDPQVIYTMEPSLYGNLLSQRQASDSSYYHFDALGSAYHLTDGTQDVVNEYLYTAFGITIPQGEKHPNVFTFVGQLGYQLDNPFWYSIRRRYYAPALARWFSRDQLGGPDFPLPNVRPLQKILAIEVSRWSSPQGSQDGQSWYSYAASMPIVDVDPTGMKSLRECYADFTFCNREARLNYRRCLMYKRRACLAWLTFDLAECRVRYEACSAVSDEVLAGIAAAAIIIAVVEPTPIGEAVVLGSACLLKLR